MAPNPWPQVPPTPTCARPTTGATALTWRCCSCWSSFSCSVMTSKRVAGVLDTYCTQSCPSSVHSLQGKGNDGPHRPSHGPAAQCTCSGLLRTCVECCRGCRGGQALHRGGTWLQASPCALGQSGVAAGGQAEAA